MESVEELVLRAQAGEAEACEAIYHRFQAMALNYAYSILGDYELAEDARQEAFVKAFCDLMALRDPAAFPGWFRQIVRKHSIQLRRGRRVILVPLEATGEPATDGQGPAARAQQRETQAFVRRAIGGLPAHERDCVELYYLEHRTLREVGEALELPVQTVKSRLHTARGRLRQELMVRVSMTISENQDPGKRKALQAATSEAISQFDHELKKLLWVPSDEELKRACRLLRAKGRLHRFMGESRQALEAFRRGMEIPALRDDPLNKALLRSDIGLTLVQTAEYGRARKEFQACQALVRRHGDRPPLMATVYNGLGMCAWGEGQFSRARRFYEQTIEANGMAEYPELQAEALNNLALLEWKAGHLEEALERFRATLKVWERVGNRYGLALTTMNAAILEENLGRFAVARRHYEQALGWARELNFVQLQAAIHSNMGSLGLAEERWSEAIEADSVALELAGRIGDRRSEAIALENLALGHIGLGEFEVAGARLAAARKIAGAIGDRERAFSLKLVEAQWDLAQAQSEGVAGRMEAAQARLKQEGFEAEWPRLLRLWAWALHLEGEDSKARRVLRRGFKQCQAQGNRVEEKRLGVLEKKIGAGR